MWQQWRRECHNNGETKMSVDTSKGHPAMDYAEHKATYAGFIKLVEYGTGALVVLLVAMYYFLVPASH